MVSLAPRTNVFALGQGPVEVGLLHAERCMASFALELPDADCLLS